MNDSSGNPMCALACTGGAICPTGATCCDPGPTHGDGGVCMPSTGQQCICTQSKDCASTACAPAVDSSGNIVGPYVCVPKNGEAHNGCDAIFQCTTPFCCITDTKGNEFCSQPCTSDSTCGKGHCDTADFTSSTCTGGTKACGL